MTRQIRKKSGTGIYNIMLRGIPLMIQSLEKVRRNKILKTKNRPHDPSPTTASLLVRHRS